jgi:hypothetical protein
VSGRFAERELFYIWSPWEAGQPDEWRAAPVVKAGPKIVTVAGAEGGLAFPRHVRLSREVLDRSGSSVPIGAFGYVYFTASGRAVREAADAAYARDHRAEIARQRTRMNGGRPPLRLVSGGGAK